MLLDTIENKKTYFKSTLIKILQEIKESSKRPIPTSYKTIIRREQMNIPVYRGVRRDPTNGWRIYTGRQIHKIVEWELKNKS